MNLSGIESATFWLIALCLNQLRYNVPLIIIIIIIDLFNQAVNGSAYTVMNDKVNRE
jgi:hypothetical protein